MRLSIEYDRQLEELDVVCDLEGLDSLIRQLVKLREVGGHAHLMTPSWAGCELTEERSSETSQLVNHLRVVLLKEGSEA